MKIKNLTLTNYRNYETLELAFDDSRNIIIGENAQGKTNLVEAIYLCSFARSFRTNSIAETIMFGKESCTVSADIEKNDFDVNVRINVNRQGKKMIKKDGKLVRKTTELLNNLVVIVFSPEDLRIIKDSPDKRRSFINKEISQLRPGYYECLKKYNDALKQKNSILKNDPSNIDDNMLDVFDWQLAVNGFEIIKYRRNFVEILSEKASEVQEYISGRREKLEIKYNESCYANSSEEMFDKIISSRDKDKYYRSCSIGPHRDDIEFYINGIDAKKFGSQGQQRTAALSLKLAEVRIAKEILLESPVLILDDVLSELDAERQRVLLNEIDDVQLFITTTELLDDLTDNMKDASVFSVQCGNITQIINYGKKE